MTDHIVVEGCPCKACTGQGLGWIKHLTKKQVSYRNYKRAMREKAMYYSDYNPRYPGEISVL